MPVYTSKKQWFGLYSKNTILTFQRKLWRVKILYYKSMPTIVHLLTCRSKAIHCSGFKIFVVCAHMVTLSPCNVLHDVNALVFLKRCLSLYCIQLALLPKKSLTGAYQNWNFTCGASGTEKQVLVEEAPLGCLGQGIRQARIHHPCNI